MGECSRALQSFIGSLKTGYFIESDNQRSSNMLIKKESVGNWGTGFTLGVHRTLWCVLFIDTYIGGGVQWSDLTKKYDPSIPMRYYSYSGITSPTYQGIMPKFGIQLGVAL